ncbi:Butyryl-CoA dehydrogenase [Pseudonocardia sp. Ae707_Ps1]|nr:Butyryl-CoA dehydrogenase [Pseudonocardia sp. Ae707_Ps1]
MDLADSPEEAAFRERVRAWLAESLPQLPWPEPVDLAEKLPFWRQWQRMLVEGELAGTVLATGVRGQGADAKLRAVSPTRRTRPAHPNVSTPSERTSPARRSSRSARPPRRSGSCGRS